MFKEVKTHNYSESFIRRYNHIKNNHIYKISAVQSDKHIAQYNEITNNLIYQGFKEIHPHHIITKSLEMEESINDNFISMPFNNKDYLRNTILQGFIYEYEKRFHESSKIFCIENVYDNSVQKTEKRLFYAIHKHHMVNNGTILYYLYHAFSGELVKSFNLVKHNTDYYSVYLHTKEEEYEVGYIKKYKHHYVYELDIDKLSKYGVYKLSESLLFKDLNANKENIVQEIINFSLKNELQEVKLVNTFENDKKSTECWRLFYKDKDRTEHLINSIKLDIFN